MTNDKWFAVARRHLNKNTNVSRETKEKFLYFLFVDDEIIEKAQDVFDIRRLDLQNASKHDLELFLKDAIFGCVETPKYSFNKRVGGKI